MTDAAKHREDIAAAAHAFVERLRHWWRETKEFDGMSRSELNRMAGELGMSGGELEALASRGPHSADLLYERMQALGLTRADVERVASGMIRDLERTCSACRDKGRCVKDLHGHPDDPVWKQYCPNVATFADVAEAKNDAN